MGPNPAVFVAMVDDILSKGPELLFVLLCKERKAGAKVWYARYSAPSSRAHARACKCYTLFIEVTFRLGLARAGVVVVVACDDPEE